jgi:hypothetical protein
MEDDHAKAPIPIAPDTIQLLLDKLNDLIKIYGNNLQPEHIAEILDIVCAADDYFFKGTSQAGEFLTFHDIEQLMLKQERLIHDANLRNLFRNMKRIEGEKIIVKGKKNSLREQGINVTSWRYCKNSIVTLVGRVHYERLALRASTRLDAQNLAAKGHSGFIFPLDERLGVNHLPYNMTIGAMLKVAEEACVANSYEDAQSCLKEIGIDVNDDTIRAVTNTIGRLIFVNEKKAADNAFSALNTGRLVFPEEKRPHILYLETDSSMVHTRKQMQTDGSYQASISDEADITMDTTVDLAKLTPGKTTTKSQWREDKLGLAFSTDNFLRWTNKHGVSQHRILKREYVSFIGQASEFSKFMFSLALRNGYGTYKTTVLISDGATWIREMRDKFFPDAQQILDYWHLCENVSTFAKNVFSCDESKYKPWTNEVTSLLKKSKTNDALLMIKSLTKRQLSKTFQNLAQYIENNRENIDYATYLAKGYFIGSGAIESSNRTVVQSRVKLLGMRWNFESIQNVTTLITKLKSKLWEQDVVNAVYRHYGLNPGIKTSSQYEQNHVA